MWAGEYIDLAYLLETNPVLEDEKSYEFACTCNSTDKLSLTTAKPKAKIDSYNSSNKAFRVLTEIVTLRDPLPCLPIVQYAAELNDNIGKFTFPVTYQYDMKFRLKRQNKPQTPWNVIDNHLWSKCFSGAAKDIYHHNNQPGNNFCSQHTCDDFSYRFAPGSNVNFNTNVPSVSSLVTTNDSATIQEDLPAPVLHPQLHEHTFNPVTLIKYQILNRLLRDHPNRSKVDYVVQGFCFGFSLKYNGPLENRQPKNLLSAYHHADKLWVSIMQEVHLGCMLGPFPVQPIDPLICLLVGMVPKHGSQEMRHITHLSHPWGQSINTFINQEDVQTHYQTFEAAVELVAWAGPGSYMAKQDFKSAFHNVPMCFADLNLLGIKVRGQIFIDTCLPFSASISCAIFEDISTLIHWIAERWAGHALVHYLDDFFYGTLTIICLRQNNV